MRLSVFYHHAKAAAAEHDCPLPVVLQSLRQAGIESVELDAPDATPETRALLEGAGLRVGSVPTWFNFAHAPYDAADDSFLEIPHAMGASHVLLLPEKATSAEDLEAGFDQVVEGIAAVTAHCRAAGLIPCIEDFDDLLAYTCRIQQLSRIFEAIPELGFNFDTGNFALTGEDPREALRQFADRIVYAHAKDRATAPLYGEGALTTEAGESLYPCPIGRGIIPFRDVLPALKAAAPECPIAIECYGSRAMLPAILSSADFLRPFL